MVVGHLKVAEIKLAFRRSCLNDGYLDMNSSTIGMMSIRDMQINRATTLGIDAPHTQLNVRPDYW